MNIRDFKRLAHASPALLIVCGLAAFCALAWGASLYMTQHTRAATAFFERALSDAGVVSVEWREVRYHVDQGHVSRGQDTVSPISTLKVLELAYKKVIAERSPVLAIPGEDLAEFRSSVERLARTQNELAGAQDSTASVTAIDDLFPILFLSELADTEDARRAFIASGADTDAARYDAALSKALSAYESDLARFRRSFAKTVSDTPVTYATADALVTKTATISALSRLNDALRTARSNVQARANCFRGIVRSCDIADISLPVIDPVAAVEIDAASLSTIRETRRLLATTLRSPEIMQAPLVALSDSACASDIPGKPIFTIYTNVVGGEAVPTAFLVGDIPLLRTDSAPLPYLRYFASQGVTYMLTPLLTHYKCLLVQSDTSKVLATIAVRTLVEKTPLSEYASDPAHSVALRTLERTIAGGYITQEADAIRYLSLARELGDSLPHDIAAQVTTLSLRFSYDTGGLGYVIRKIAVAEHTNHALSRTGVATEVGAQHLFFSESGFIPLFLGDNGSFADTSRPLMPPNTIPPSDEPYLYYSTMPHTEQLSQTVARDIAFFTDMYADLSPR